MARLTIKRVNRALRAIDPSAELVKGDGYFYFVADGSESWPRTAVYVHRINDMTLEQWVSDFQELRKTL